MSQHASRVGLAMSLAWVIAGRNMFATSVIRYSSTLTFCPSTIEAGTIKREQKTPAPFWHGISYCWICPDCYKRCQVDWPEGKALETQTCDFCKIRVDYGYLFPFDSNDWFKCE